MPEHELLRIEQLLKAAKSHNERDRYDITFYCQPEDIDLLLEYGADPRGLNVKQVDRGYVHKVFYEGHLFVTATADRVPAFTWHTARQN